MSLFGSEINFLRKPPIERLFLRVFGSWHTGARIRAFHIFRTTSKYLKGGCHILDAGCGLGRHTFFIAGRYPNTDVVAVDFDGENISTCKRIREMKGFDNVKFQFCDLRHLNSNEGFDLIICSDVLEYIREDNRVLANFKNSLRENGRLVLHTPRLNPRRYLGLFERYFRCDIVEKSAHARDGYTDVELRGKLKKNGLKVTGLKYTFGVFGSLSWELSKILERVKPLFVLCFPIILLLGYMDSLTANRDGNGILIEARRSNVAGHKGIASLPKVAKVLYLNPTSEVGGAERSLLDLLRHIDKGKYHPIVCLPSEGKLTWELGRMGLETKMIPLHPAISRLSREDEKQSFHRFLSIPWHLLPTILKIATLVRSKDIDFIVTNGIKCHLIGCIVSSMTRTKLIWHVRDLIDAGWLRPMMWSLGRFFPDKIIANSDAVGRVFSNNGRIEIIHNGIDLARFDTEIDGEGIRSEFNVEKGTKLIGTIGHFAPLKGYEELLNAMGEVVGNGFDVKLVMVGESIYPHSKSYKEKLFSLVDSPELKERVIFAGFREDIPELLASFDVFVLPSRSEGFGRVNLEAMAMGKPVISTNVGGIPEVVLDGVTGILVPPGNPNALSRALMMLLDDPSQRESMGREGRKRVEEHFTLQGHVQRIQEIYRDILRTP
ncbi:MAG: glycosyltransferase [Promethearchaeota archaeon]